MMIVVPLSTKQTVTGLMKYSDYKTFLTGT